MNDKNAHVANANNRKTVLLVDDDAKLLRGLVRSFAGEDYETLTAVSAAEADVLLARNNVDLVVSDNLMAGVLGTDFLTNVRQRYPRIKLLMLSGYMPPAAVRRVTDDVGVERVLLKPCHASEVAAAIRELLDISSNPKAEAAGELSWNQGEEAPRPC